MLSSAISSTKADTNQCIDYFNKFDFLWKADREATIQVVMVFWLHKFLQLGFLLQYLVMLLKLNFSY